MLNQQKDFTVNFNTILGKDYIKLREFAKIVSNTNKQFEVKYNSETNTVQIKKGGVYTSVGNEMLLDNSEKYITQKSNYQITLDNVPVELSCYTIDGDLYVDMVKFAELLGMNAEKKQDGKGYIITS